MVKIIEQIGDIFKSPPGSVLIHACNCQGAWGSGVAAAFKSKFPAAYERYHEHCTIPDNISHKKKLLGTALLIPPQEGDDESGQYWIGCLFTSLNYGRKADKPDVILEQTRKALLDLRAKIETTERSGANLKDKLYAVRINGLAFKTPWERTRKVMEQGTLAIKVVNNVEIMAEGERSLVLKQMEEWGFNIERAQNYKEEPARPEDVAPEDETQDEGETATGTHGKKRKLSEEKGNEDNEIPPSKDSSQKKEKKKRSKKLKENESKK